MGDSPVHCGSNQDDKEVATGREILTALFRVSGCLYCGEFKRLLARLTPEVKLSSQPSHFSLVKSLRLNSLNLLEFKKKTIPTLASGQGSWETR